ncbi:type III restriction modification system:Methylase, partial [Mycoplasmopsis columbina SF7]
NAIADDKENINNNKFIYRDKFSRNGWLNMMNERLQLAKQLLKEDGVIFVSIDDNEHAYLKILMDEIFGEENFICNFIWEKNYSPKSNSKFVSINHDYILCYVKNKIKLSDFKRLSRNEKNNKQYKFDDNDGRGLYKSSALTRVGGYVFNIIHNFIEYAPPLNAGWIYSKEKMEKMIADNRIIFPKNSNGRPSLKRYLNEVNDLISLSILNYEIVGHTQDSKNELISIIRDSVFATPKPIDLLTYLIKLYPNKNAKVLDFFAGSGTTGHAVLELNRQDGGNRTFTLVTNNENNIAIDTTYERLYRINKGVGTKNETFEWSKKNKLYNSALSVFNTKYLNIGLKNKNAIEQLLKDIQQMLKDFGVNSKIESVEKLLPRLRSLKSLEN